MLTEKKKKVGYQPPKRNFTGRRKGFVKTAPRMSKDARALRRKPVKEDLSHIRDFVADPDVHATAAATVGGYASLAAMDRVQAHKQRRAAHHAGRKMIAGMTGKPAPKTLSQKIKHGLSKIKGNLKKRFKEEINPTEIVMTESDFENMVDFMLENYEEEEVLNLLLEWAQLDEDFKNPKTKLGKKSKVIVKKGKRYWNGTDG